MLIYGELLPSMKLWNVAIVPNELIIHNFDIGKKYAFLHFLDNVIQDKNILLEVFRFLTQNLYEILFQSNLRKSHRLLSFLTFYHHPIAECFFNRALFEALPAFTHRLNRWCFILVSYSKKHLFPSAFRKHRGDPFLFTRIEFNRCSSIFSEALSHFCMPQYIALNHALELDHLDYDYINRVSNTKSDCAPALIDPDIDFLTIFASIWSLWR